MPRRKERCEESRYDVTWVLTLAALFVIAKQTFGLPCSWWWTLLTIPMGIVLDRFAPI